MNRKLEAESSMLEKRIEWKQDKKEAFISIVYIWQKRGMRNEVPGRDEHHASPIIEVFPCTILGILRNKFMTLMKISRLARFILKPQGGHNCLEYAVRASPAR